MLLSILFIIALMALMAVVITKMTLWMISNLGHKYIEKTHRGAEFIINTRQVPPFWIARKGLIRSPLYRKYRALKNLKKIISYFRTNTVAGDEESRMLIVKRLTEIYNEWTDREWEEMAPHASR